jgi:RNA polymerase sigma-70 factor (ECF subfamily)
MAILLYDVDGYDYAEIATLVGASVGTVKSRISRGRAELRRLLSDVHGNRAPRGDVTEG